MRLGLPPSPRPECSGVIFAICSFNLSGSSDPSTSALQAAGTTDTCHHAQLIFGFIYLFMFGESGFCLVAQAGLELLTSDDPLALASQSAGVTGVSCHTQPGIITIMMYSWKIRNKVFEGKEMGSQHNSASWLQQFSCSPILYI